MPADPRYGWLDIGDLVSIPWEHGEEKSVPDPTLRRRFAIWMTICGTPRAGPRRKPTTKPGTTEASSRVKILRWLTKDMRSIKRNACRTRWIQPILRILTRLRPGHRCVDPLEPKNMEGESGLLGCQRRGNDQAIPAAAPDRCEQSLRPRPRPSPGTSRNCDWIPDRVISFVFHNFPPVSLRGKKGNGCPGHPG